MIDTESLRHALGALEAHVVGAGDATPALETRQNRDQESSSRSIKILLRVSS